MFHIPAHKNVAAPAAQCFVKIEDVKLAPRLPDIDKIIAFESGELDQDQVVELIQQGIDAGWVWHLQGFYGRTARDLINAGLCHE